MWFQIAIVIELLGIIWFLSYLRSITYWMAQCRIEFNSLNECLRNMTYAANSVNSTLDKMNSRSAEADACNNAPILVPINLDSEHRSDRWIIRNCGNGLAVNVTCSININVDNRRGTSVNTKKKDWHLRYALQTTHDVTLPDLYIQQLNESLTFIKEMADTVYELESQGYKYIDLYGEPTLDVRYRLDYESINGDKFETSCTWLNGRFKVECGKREVDGHQA